MPFLAVGVEHGTSPLAVRERVSLDPEGIARASHELAAHDTIDEVTILSTCNRTEVYLFSSDVRLAGDVARAYLARIEPDVEPYLQRWEEIGAIEHLFRVTAGLESQVLGEPQILGQVADALQLAQHEKTVGPHLHALFRATIACARQARAGTAFGRMDLSIGSEAVRTAERALGSFKERSALVIGAGEISRRVVEELRAGGIGGLYIANRTESVAVELAQSYRGTPVRLTDLPRILPSIDLLISATSAASYVVTPEVLDDAVLDRSEPLYVFDLAIPRDVDPAVSEYPGIRLYDLDGLLPTEITDQWDADLRSIEGVIAAEIREFMAWYLTRRAVPVIASLRNHVEAVSRQEMKRVEGALSDLNDRERAAVESLTNRLIDKMFHHLVVRLRLAAQTDPKLVDAAEFFFLHGEGGLFDHAAELESRADTTRRRLNT